MKQSTNKLLLAYFIYEIRLQINSEKLQKAGKSKSVKSDDVIEQMRNENLIISPKHYDVRNKLKKIFGKQIEEFKIL